MRLGGMENWNETHPHPQLYELTLDHGYSPQWHRYCEGIRRFKNEAELSLLVNRCSEMIVDWYPPLLVQTDTHILS